LRSIQKKVRGQKGREKASGHSLFTSWHDLEDDMTLIWNNARQYNEEGSEIYAAAGELEVCATKDSMTMD
jgi:Bromodomain